MIFVFQSKNKLHQIPWVIMHGLISDGVTRFIMDQQLLNIISCSGGSSKSNQKYKILN